MDQNERSPESRMDLVQVGDNMELDIFISFAIINRQKLWLHFASFFRPLTNKVPEISR